MRIDGIEPDAGPMTGMVDAILFQNGAVVAECGRSNTVRCDEGDGASDTHPNQGHNV